MPEGKDLTSFHGQEGDWVKVGILTPTLDPETENWWAFPNGNIKDFNITLPASTPPGKYLFRIEHVYASPNLNLFQMYVNCAHINILTSSVSPGTFEGYPFQKFPGTYTPQDPGEQDMSPQLIWSAHC